jgi:hypothetical protein
MLCKSHKAVFAAGCAPGRDCEKDIGVYCLHTLRIRSYLQTHQQEEVLESLLTHIPRLNRRKYRLSHRYAVAICMSRLKAIQDL